MISVIVPIYNGEDYISLTIESLLAQTFKDFELIIVDDGSTDSTPIMCEEFAKKDDRIKLYHKPNGGLSDARNFGLEHAKGEYILFSDGDDYHYPDNLEVMAQQVKGFDSLICGPDYLECDRDEIEEFRTRPHGRFSELIDINKEEDFAKHWPAFDCLCIGQVWRQLYRRDIIEKYHLRFEGLGYEDSIFSYSYYLHIRSARLSGFRGYIHLFTKGSLSSSHKTVQDMSRIKRLSKLHEDFIKLHNITDKEYFHNLQNRYMLLAATSIMKGYYKDTRLHFKERINCWKEVELDYWFKNLHYSILKGFRSKLFYIACRLRLQYLFDPILITLFNFKR